jgi:hypothetical protein
VIWVALLRVPSDWKKFHEDQLNRRKSPPFNTVAGSIVAGGAVLAEFFKSHAFA